MDGKIKPCLVCGKEAERKLLYISNDIKINECYDMSDDLQYCAYCGAIFVHNYNLGIKEEDNGSS